MKKRITKKELFSSFTNIKSARAYELQSLLFNHEPIGYACGSCGWDYDIYEVYGVTICTGYRNTPKNELKEVELYEQKPIKRVLYLEWWKRIKNGSWRPSSLETTHCL